MVPIDRALWACGCEAFWVGSFAEATALRAALPASRIFVMQGLEGHPPEAFAAARLVPMLASLAEARRCADCTTPPPAVGLQLDCGLTRLGLMDEEALALAHDQALRSRLEVVVIGTQLVEFAQPGHPGNERQLERFLALASRLGPATLSIASSSGIVMPARFHLDLGRVGSALYGVQTTPGVPQPVRPAYRVLAPILRLAEIGAGATVGYAGSWQAPMAARIATIGLGYAHGMPTTLARTGTALRLAGHPAPISGRISMSLMMLDVSQVPAEAARSAP